MQQLTRKWWKRGRKENNYDDDGNVKCSLSIPDDNHPLDIQDQEQIVRDFEKTHACQSRLWRSVFGGFLFSYAVFLLYSTVQQAWYPWELRYHAYFMDEIHSSTVIVADLVAVIACLLAVKGLLQNSSSYQQWMWYSCYTGLLLAVFWLYYMTRNLKIGHRSARSRWDTGDESKIVMGDECEIEMGNESKIEMAAIDVQAVETFSFWVAQLSTRPMNWLPACIQIAKVSVGSCVASPWTIERCCDLPLCGSLTKRIIGGYQKASGLHV